MSKKKILIVGSGGREDALEDILTKEGHKVYVAPGNGGSSNPVSVDANDFYTLADFAYENDCFVIFGSENQICKGGVDTIALKTNMKVKTLGPDKIASFLECDKTMSKKFMGKYGIPTPKSEIFYDYNKARDYIERIDTPFIIKIPEPFGGKGVFICKERNEGRNILDKIMRGIWKTWDRVIVEEFIHGREVTAMYLVDGKHYKRLAPAQDYKRLQDGGPNTGGVGSYSPVPFFDENLQKKADEIIEKTIRGLNLQGIHYTGVIYEGLIIDEKGNIKVLEYNARFGDPEAQTVLPRLKSPLYPYLEATVDGKLDEMEDLRWKNEVAACLVLVSKGYPELYETNKRIYGLHKLEGHKNLCVYHSGTIKRENEFFTNSGRVLSLVALANSYQTAFERVYEAANQIIFEGMTFNPNIGREVLTSKHDSRQRKLDHFK